MQVCFPAKHSCMKEICSANDTRAGVASQKSDLTYNMNSEVNPAVCSEHSHWNRVFKRHLKIFVFFQSGNILHEFL